MMEQSEFDRLQREVKTPVAENEEPKSKLERIRKQLADAVQSGALQVVDREEVNLVAEFRIWKASPQVVSGIFHYKRKERHESV
jgi:hypothetical protein